MSTKLDDFLDWLYMHSAAVYGSMILAMVLTSLVLWPST